MSVRNIINAMLAARERIPRDLQPVVYIDEGHPWFDVADLLADRFGRTPTLREVIDEIREQGRDPNREALSLVAEKIASDKARRSAL